RLPRPLPTRRSSDLPDPGPVRQAAHGAGEERARAARQRARGRHRPEQALRDGGGRGQQGRLPRDHARRHGERPAHRHLGPQARRAHHRQRPATRAPGNAGGAAGSERIVNLSRFFIDRPIFAGVLSVLIFLGGMIALRSLPIAEYPEVVPPSIVVRANYPGANPKVIAETVATPLEEAINGVEGMLYMSSQGTTDGLMTLTVTFKLGTDPDKAQQQVQNRVALAEPRLPDEVPRLGITTVKGATDLTMVVHLVSPNER